MTVRIFQFMVQALLSYLHKTGKLDVPEFCSHSRKFLNSQDGWSETDKLHAKTWIKYIEDTNPPLENIH